MIDCIRFTTMIKWGYEGKELPKSFVIKVGRSSGNYGTAVGPSSPHIREYGCEHFNYDGLGTYYVKVFAVDKNNNEVGGDEFVINLIDPVDSVVSPSGVRFVNNE